MNAKTSTRRLDIDWLRIILILIVFFYHSNRFFNNEYWHVANGTSGKLSIILTSSMYPWMMSTIMILSAASIVYSLNSRSTGKFIVDKVKRLLIPLVFGIFALALPQVYLERLSHGEFIGSFFQFLPHFFEGMYGFGGNFAWMGLHLWYLLVLFLYTLIFLPVFLVLRTKIGSAIVRGFAWLFSKPGLIYLLLIFPTITMELVSRDNPFGMTDFGGISLASYVVYFLLGFLIFSDERLQRAIIRQRWVSLVLCVGLYLIWRRNLLGISIPWGQAFEDVFPLEPGFAWTSILTILGMGMRYLKADNRFLRYANEAVLPFYMLHQTVLIVIGYFVVQQAWSVTVKWLVITPLSFATIMLIYEFLVRRLNVLRFLFGMKLIKRAKASQKSMQPAAETN
jgi:glucan biosynthesis protein C